MNAVSKSRALTFSTVYCVLPNFTQVTFWSHYHPTPVDLPKTNKCTHSTFTEFSLLIGWIMDEMPKYVVKQMDLNSFVIDSTVASVFKSSVLTLLDQCKKIRSLPRPGPRRSCTPVCSARGPEASGRWPCTSRWWCRKRLGASPMSPRWSCRSGRRPGHSVGPSYKLEGRKSTAIWNGMIRTHRERYCTCEVVCEFVLNF